MPVFREDHNQEYRNGVLVSDVVVQTDITVEANTSTLLNKALQALATNQDFLDLPNPTPGNTTYLAQAPIPGGTLTAAQLGVALRIVRTQVDSLTRQNNELVAQNIALTRQVNGLIRLLLRDLQDISDT